MKTGNALINNVDHYIAGFPKGTQQLLKQLRATIKKAVPAAEECISYQMPAYKYHGILVYFAAFKNHIGFYPTSTGITAFKEDLTGFTYSKGAVQFPLDKPLPLELITNITQFRAKENHQQAELKAGLKRRKI